MDCIIRREIQAQQSRNQATVTELAMGTITYRRKVAFSVACDESYIMQQISSGPEVSNLFPDACSRRAACVAYGGLFAS